MSVSSFLNPTQVIKAAKLQEGMHVADFGAGSGFFTRAAAREVGQGGVVWAVETQRELLPRLKHLACGEGLHNVEVVHGDIELEGGSNLPAEAFDVVIAANLFFSLEHKAAAVAEIKRVLKKNGRAVVVDWSDSFGGLGPHPGHVVKADPIQKLFEQHGFTLAEELHTGAFHWGFIVRKKS